MNDAVDDGDIAYTRSGNLKSDADGRLVTSDGFTIEPYQRERLTGFVDPVIVMIAELVSLL